MPLSSEKYVEIFAVLLYNIHHIFIQRRGHDRGGGNEKNMRMLISCPRGRTFDSFFTNDNITLAQSLGEVLYNPYEHYMTPTETTELLGGCDVYVSTWGAPRLDEHMLAEAKSLKAVVHLGGTPLPFVCEQAWKKGVCVLSGESYYAASRAEGTLAYMLAALRDIPEYSQRLKYQREWKHSWDNNRGLVGKTVGLINYDPVAVQLAKLLSSFDVRLVVFDDRTVPASHRRAYRMEQMSSIEEVIMQSDVISIHSPARSDRYHMISSSELAHLKNGALVVDTSEGGVLNRAALASVLVTGRVSAILDLCEREVTEIDESFFYLPNVTLMPHMAGPTPDTRSVVARELLCECAEYVEHGKRPKHAVSLCEAKRRRKNAL